MRRYVVGALAALAACGGGKQDEAAASFITQYEHVVSGVAEVCSKRSSARISSPGTVNNAQDAAFGVVLARKVKDYSLPEVTGAMSVCRKGAVEAFDALRTSLAPVVAKADEKADGPIITAVWLEAKPSVEKALAGLQTNWRQCKEEAERANIPHTPLLSPHFMTGC